MCADTNAKTQSPHPQFKLINLSATPINLSTLTIRYWFTGDGAVTFGGAIDFASNSAGTQIQSQMSLTFVSVSRTGADHYMQINYGAGAGTLTNASPVFAQSRFNSTNPDFGITFTQTGDYSFDASKTAFTDWTQVTMYQNGTLIWGIEPP
jgi:cellulose 1,4-beta-cellobiosidase